MLHTATRYLALPIILAATLASSQQSPVFDPGVRTLPVIVTDSSGKHVSGLTQPEFKVVITLNKKDRDLEIISTEEVRATQFVADAGATPQMPIYVLFDEMVDFPGSSPNDIRKDLVRLLAQGVQSNQQFDVLICGPDGVGVVHHMAVPLPVLGAALQRVDRETRVLAGKYQLSAAADSLPLVEQETARLTAFLRGDVWVGDNPNNRRLTSQEKGRREPTGSLQNYTKRRLESEYASLRGLGDRDKPQSPQELAEERQVRFTPEELGCLETLAKVFSRIPGRKSLIWIAPGNPLSGTDAEPQIELFNQARVSVYPTAASARLATPTGGRTVGSSGGPVGMVEEVQKDAGSYYLVRVRVPVADRLPTPASLLVTVARPGVELRAPKSLSLFPAQSNTTSAGTKK